MQTMQENKPQGRFIIFTIIVVVFFFFFFFLFFFFCSFLFLRGRTNDREKADKILEHRQKHGRVRKKSAQGRNNRQKQGDRRSHGDAGTPGRERRRQTPCSSLKRWRSYLTAAGLGRTRNRVGQPKVVSFARSQIGSMQRCSTMACARRSC